MNKLIIGSLYSYFNAAKCLLWSIQELKNSATHNTFKRTDLNNQFITSNWDFYSEKCMHNKQKLKSHNSNCYCWEELLFLKIDFDSFPWPWIFGRENGPSALILGDWKQEDKILQNNRIWGSTRMELHSHGVHFCSLTWPPGDNVGEMIERAL